MPDILTLQSFVTYLASKVAICVPPNITLDELVSAGNLGLMDAIDKFDPERQNKFKTYAEIRIKGAILDELRRLDPLPRSIRRTIDKVEKAIGAATERLRRPPEHSEVAQELGVEIEEYYKLQVKIQGQDTLRLDLPLQNDRKGGREESNKSNGAAYKSTLRDDLTPLSLLVEKEKSEMLHDAIKPLSWRTKEVLWLYYWQGYTEKAIGNVFDRTEGWASFELTKAREIIGKRLNGRYKE